MNDGIDLCIHWRQDITVKIGRSLSTRSPGQFRQHAFSRRISTRFDPWGDDFDSRFPLSQWPRTWFGKQNSFVSAVAPGSELKYVMVRHSYQVLYSCHPKIYYQARSCFHFCRHIQVCFLFYFCEDEEWNMRGPLLPSHSTSPIRRLSHSPYPLLTLCTSASILECSLQRVGIEIYK